MSERQIATELLDRVPDYKIAFVIAYLQGLTAGEDIPNDETLTAMKELDEGRGDVFSGSTANMIAAILEEED